MSKKPGRKTKYYTNVQPKLFLIENWCKDGLTEAEIMKRLGIGHDSFYKYKQEHTEFAEALKNGKEIADYRVEDALYNRAMGITKHVEKVRIINGQPVTYTEEIYFPPDVTAQIFWMKNRRPDKWRDVKDHNVNVKKLEDFFTDEN